jgi:hypothetical protein
MITFEKEITTYLKKLADFLPVNEGKFVLIKGQTVYGFFQTREDARSCAKHKKRIKPPFLVHKIVKTEPVCQMGGILLAPQNKSTGVSK